MSSEALFREINAVIPNLDGWCTPERACLIAEYVLARKPKQSVCLGVWGGRDTFALAMAHRLTGFGKVLAVDPWRADASISGQNAVNAAWWGNQEMHDLVYSRFMGNVIALGLEAWIDVRRQAAADAAVPTDIGILLIDGNHGPASIADEARWAPHVAVGGLVYVDDIKWEGGHVQEAVTNLMARGFVKLRDCDTGAVFERTAPVAQPAVQEPAPRPARKSRVSKKRKAKR